MTDVLLAPPAATQRRAKPVGPLAVPVCAVGVLGAVGLGMVLGYTEIDVWGAFIIPVILVMITVPMLGRSAWLRAEGLVGMASLALVAKLVGSYLRYLMEFHVYSGADSRRYHINGTRIATEYLEGRRSLFSLFPSSTGTEFLDELNGVVSLLSGRSTMASFMVFSWLAFLGVLGFVAAARTAIPGFPVRSYAIAVFFFPSMLFWSSALGKDAWIVFGMGLFAFGVSRLFAGSVSGAAWLFVGGMLIAVVRPHITALLLVALCATLLVGRSITRAHTYVVALVMSAVLAGFASRVAADVLPGINEGVGAVLESTQQRTSIGGSEIEAVVPNSPAEYLWGLITVIFRPFLFETSSLIQVLSALEGTALLIWMLAQCFSSAGTLRTNVRHPYLRFAFIYILGFSFAWASIGNLGIIVRQRVQVIPLLLLAVLATMRHQPRLR